MKDETQMVELNRTEDGVVEGESSYRDIFNSASEGLLLHDDTGRILLANDRLCELLGYSKEELVQLSVRDLGFGQPPYAEAEAVEHIRHALEHGHCVFPWRSKRKNGEVFWSEIALRSCVIAGKKRFLASVRNIDERKEAERLKDDAMSYLQTLLGASPLGIVTYKASGQAVSANAAAARLIGATVESMRKQNFREIASWKQSGLLKMAELALATGQEQWFEEHLVSTFGKEIWVSTQFVPFHFAGEAHLLSLWLDISERKKAEAVLRDRETRIEQLLKEQQTMLESAPIGIALTKGRVVQWANPAHLALYGSSAEEMLGMNSSVFYVHAEDYERVGREAAVEFDQGRSYTTEVEFKRKDGSAFWCQLHGRAIEPADPAAGVIWMLMDVTERKKAREDLARSEAELAAIHDSSPLMMCLVNEKREVERMNRALAEFAESVGLGGFGERHGDVLGCVNALDNPQGCGFGKLCQDCSLRSAILKTFETGQPCRQVESDLFLIRGGLSREVQVLASTSLLKVGGTARVLLCLEDITRRKRLEAQFLHAQKMESVGQLAGGVAHDFNNILAAFMLHLSLLRQNPSLDSETQESLKVLLAEAKRATNLTRQLLMFSRRSILEVRVLDINELVGNLLSMLCRLIGEDITVRFDRTQAPAAVEADPGMIEQVLMNLALNARDSMPTGGSLTIGTALVQIDSAQTRGAFQVLPGEFVCLSVVDTGSGMDAATLKHVFEPFFTTKEPGKGTGLGLATVHGIVAQHKGWVEVDSEPGRGSSFKVFFPATTKAISGSSQPGEVAAARGHETILLVEDEASLRRVVGRVLRQLGYRVMEAANGQTAMALWQKHSRHIDLLLSDMVMPEGMTGLELAEKLKAERPGLKVIISSGYNTETAGKTGPWSGEIRYLQKPYPIELMSTMVRDCLDGR